MKKALSLFLIFALLFVMVPGSYAANDETIAAADRLHSLGLFGGTGINPDGSPIYELDREPTRLEAITMLVRLLGKESEALTGFWDTPFTDVADWAKAYVGFAYANKLTSGTSETTFGSDDLITASQYLTFVLRALGYESGIDFEWDAAWELSDEIGITSGEYHSYSVFLRGDIARISVNALSAYQKNSTETLADKLIYEGVFSDAQYWDDELLVLDPFDFDIDPETERTIEPNPESVTDPNAKHDYVKSINSNVFHYLWCGEADHILEKNRQFYYEKTREEMLDLGFRPCKVCTP